MAAGARLTLGDTNTTWCVPTSPPPFSSSSTCVHCLLGKRAQTLRTIMQENISKPHKTIVENAECEC